MKLSPGKLMFLVWATCILTWSILPFQLTQNKFSILGLLIFFVFISFFLLGSYIRKLIKLKPSEQNWKSIAVKNASRVLELFSFFSSLLFLIDYQSSNIFDLTETYQLRSDQADALLNASSSNSSLAFQIAFLIYPAGNVYIALKIIYEKNISYIKLLLYGFLPIFLASFVMGGRIPIFYATVIAFLSWRIRKNYALQLGYETIQSSKWNFKKGLITSIALVMICISFYYFAAVFFVRAEVVGGSDGMFVIAEEVWGIKFTGIGSAILFSTLGNNGTFLLFIFSWYLVKGLLMSNILFINYDGPLQLGTYGIDIISAIVRRTNGAFLSKNFASLLDLGTYGFLPSAFGSLFVDFHFFSLIICFFWGWWAMGVHKKSKHGNLRSMLLIPFMVAGIFFSLINTPFGVTNGFITHIWLFVAYFLVKNTSFNIPNSNLN
jgi:hypothetical protein